ncbi:MAG TPA: glycosyl hydrolase family 28-related protein [Trebonia sp.]
MSSTIEIILSIIDGTGAAVTEGSAVFTATSPVISADGTTEIIPAPVTIQLGDGPPPVSATLLPTDVAGDLPIGWAWQVSFPDVPGDLESFTFAAPAGPASFAAAAGTPGVITWTATAALTALPNGTGVKLTGGSLPTGITAGTTYFVVGTSGQTIQLAATPGGSPLTLTSSGSGQLTVVSYYLASVTRVTTGAALSPLASYFDELGAAAAAQAAAEAASMPTLAQVAVSTAGTLAVNKVTTVTAAAALTMTLPTPVTGAWIVCERASASTAAVTITGNVRGAAGTSVTLQLGSESEMFFATGGSWWPIAGHKTLGSLDTRYTAWLNVKGAAFGAKGDGTTDDTAAINLALSTATPGQVVYLPAGTYVTSAPLVVPSGVILRGDSGGLGIPIGNYSIGGLPVGGTIIKPAAGFTGIAVISMTQASGQGGQQQFYAFSVDGSNVTGTNTIHGIEATSAVAAVKMRDVLVYGGNGALGGDGLHVAAGSNGLPDFWDVAHCKFSGFKGNGVSLNGLADSFFFACESTGNTGWGWTITNGNNSRFVGCKAEGAGTNGGWQLTAASGFTGQLTFSACTSGSNHQDGWQVNGPGAGVYSISGCRSTNDGLTSGAGFTVQAGYAGTVQLTGVDTVPATSTPAYGLKVSAVAGTAVIQVANSTLWGVTGGVSNDASTPNVLYDGNCVLTSGALASPAPVPQPQSISQGGTSATTAAAALTALGALRPLAATAAGGYTQVNGTGTVLTWTAPNDGQLHRVILLADLHVTTTQVGGAITMNCDFPDGFANAPSVFAGAASPGGYGAFVGRVVEAGATVTITQSSALTSGAAVMWAELWGC